MVSRGGQQAVIDRRIECRIGEVKSLMGAKEKDIQEVVSRFLENLGEAPQR